MAVASAAEAKAAQALDWIQRSVRQLVPHMVRLGQRQADGKIHVRFGMLFAELQGEFAALSATLRTAKRHGIVAYDGEQLLQTLSDDVDVTLLVEDAQAAVMHDDRRRGDDAIADTAAVACPAPDAPCCVCAQAIAPLDRVVVAADDVRHARCFTCSDCHAPLTLSDFGYMRGTVYCAPHYKQRFLSHADYDRGFA